MNRPLHCTTTSSRLTQLINTDSASCTASRPATRPANKDRIIPEQTAWDTSLWPCHPRTCLWRAGRRCDSRALRTTGALSTRRRIWQVSRPWLHAHPISSCGRRIDLVFAYISLECLGSLAAMWVVGWLESATWKGVWTTNSKKGETTGRKERRAQS